METIKEFLSSLFSGDINRVPTEVMSNHFLNHTDFMKDYNDCYHSATKSYSARWEQDCLENSHVADYCRHGTNEDGNQSPEVLFPGDDEDDDEDMIPLFIYNSERNLCPQYLEMARSSVQSSSFETFSNYSAFSSRNHTIFQKFYKYENCIAKLDKAVQKCSKTLNLNSRSLATSIRAAKILRLKMLNMEPVIKSIPDISVIYYTRDPRAIVTSKAHSSNSKQWINNVINLCSEMYSDYLELKRLDQIYPGVFLQLRYEDLIENPMEILHSLYDHFDTKPLESVEKWLMSTMYANKQDGSHGVMRKNASETAHKWQDIIPQTKIDYVNENPMCKKLLFIFGYS